MSGEDHIWAVPLLAALPVSAGRLNFDGLAGDTFFNNPFYGLPRTLWGQWRPDDRRGGRHRPRAPRVGPGVGRPRVPSARRPPRRRVERAARRPGPAVALLPAGADAPRPRYPAVRDARSAHRLRVPVRRLRRDGPRLDVRPGPQGSAQAPACRPGPPLSRVRPLALVAFGARGSPAPLSGGHGLREARGAPALHGAAARHPGPGRRQPGAAGALSPRPRLCRPQRVSAPAPRRGLAGGPAARSASRPGGRGLAGSYRAGPRSGAPAIEDWPGSGAGPPAAGRPRTARGRGGQRSRRRVAIAASSTSTRGSQKVMPIARSIVAAPSSSARAASARAVFQ